MRKPPSGPGSSTSAESLVHALLIRQWSADVVLFTLAVDRYRVGLPA